MYYLEEADTIFINSLDAKAALHSIQVYIAYAILDIYYEFTPI